MQEIIDSFMNVAKRRKIDYADIRVLDRRHEGITVRDGLVDDLDRSTELVFGLRVLHKGRWGFAASRDVSRNEAALITEQAIRIAEAAARAAGEPTRLDDSPPEKAEYNTP